MTLSDAIKYARQHTYQDGAYASYHAPQYDARMAHTYPNARRARDAIRNARIMLALYALGWTPEAAQEAANDDSMRGRAGDWTQSVRRSLTR